jgi:hypothetical protein
MSRSASISFGRGTKRSPGSRVQRGDEALPFVGLGEVGRVEVEAVDVLRAHPLGQVFTTECRISQHRADVFAFQPGEMPFPGADVGVERA